MNEISRTMKVFVQLAYGYDADRWEKRWLSGSLLGTNERLPYGYHHAREMGCSVEYSRDAAETTMQKFFRLVLRAVLGFDFLHTWRNRSGVLSATTVWTHTESQHLAVALLLKLIPSPRRPVVIGQSVWLMDRWDRFGVVRKLFYRWLLSEIDALTFLSPNNTKRAMQVFGADKCQMVKFGIKGDDRSKPKIREALDTVRLLAIGNDRHRDWDCLVKAFANEPRIEVDIVSQTMDPRLLRGIDNIRLKEVRCQSALVEAYERADIVVIPLRPNLHASGISCIEEALNAGKPVVCSRAGGLTGYFNGREVAYAEPGSPMSLRQSVLWVASDPNRRRDMVLQAQSRMVRDGLDSRTFVRRHVEISRALCLENKRDIRGAVVTAREISGRAMSPGAPEEARVSR